MICQPWQQTFETFIVICAAPKGFVESLERIHRRGESTFQLKIVSWLRTTESNKKVNPGGILPLLMRALTITVSTFCMIFLVAQLLTWQLCFFSELDFAE